MWSRSTKAQLKPVHVLGNIYFLMSPYDLDELCEWVRNRSFFGDKDFTIDGLLEYEEQCSSSSSSISSRILEITNEEHNDYISYQPVCSEWQKERCALLGLTFILVNHPHLTQPSMIAVSHCPLTTARIAADGNCFFRSVSLAVTGSQEFHEELRPADHNVHDPQINRSNVILPWIPRWLWKLYEAIKDADSGHLGYRIGGDCSSIIA